jgi:DNA-directed RNA polymerase specialized sigma24 family protein
MDQHQSRDDSVEQRRNELIQSTKDLDFKNKVSRCAYKIVGNKIDADDYSQEAIARFISWVKNKTSLTEMESIKVDKYVYQIVRNIHKDRWSKMHNPKTTKNNRHQMNQSQEDTLEEQGRQNLEILAAQLGMSVEDISDQQVEKGQRGSTRLGVEEQVVSEIIVETFISSLPYELGELTRLLTFEDYKLCELTKILKLSSQELKYRKKLIREALFRFRQEQIQLEKASSAYER